MRRVAHQPAPLVERLVHEPDVTVLQVSQSTVDQLRTLRRRAAREVVALDQRHPQPAMRRVEGDAGAGDATADHEHVERVVTVERVLGAARRAWPTARTAAFAMSERTEGGPFAHGRGFARADGMVAMLRRPLFGAPITAAARGGRGPEAIR